MKHGPWKVAAQKAVTVILLKGQLSCPPPALSEGNRSSLLDHISITQSESSPAVKLEEARALFKSMDRLDPDSVVTIADRYASLDTEGKKELWFETRKALAECTGLKCESDTAETTTMRASRTFFKEVDKKYQDRIQANREELQKYQLRANMIRENTSKFPVIWPIVSTHIQKLHDQTKTFETDRSHFTTKKTEIDESKLFSSKPVAPIFGILTDPSGVIAYAVHDYRYAPSNMYAFAYLPKHNSRVAELVKLLQENDPNSRPGCKDSETKNNTRHKGPQDIDSLKELVDEFTQLDKNERESFWPEAWFKLGTWMGLECHKDGTTSISRTTLEKWIAELDTEIMQLNKKIQEHEEDDKRLSGEEFSDIDREIKKHLYQEITNLKEKKISAEEDKAYFEKLIIAKWGASSYTQSQILYAHSPSLFVLPFLSPTILPKNQDLVQSLVIQLNITAGEYKTTVTSPELILPQHSPTPILFKTISPLATMESYTFNFPGHPSSALKNRDVEFQAALRIHSNGDISSQFRRATSWFEHFDELAKRTGLEVVRTNSEDAVVMKEDQIVVSDFRLAISFPFFDKLQGSYRHKIQEAYKNNDMISWRRLFQEALFFSNLVEEHRKPNPTFFSFQKSDLTDVVSFTVDAADGRKYVTSNDKDDPFDRPDPFVFAVLPEYRITAENLVNLLRQHDPRPLQVSTRHTRKHNWAEIPPQNNSN